MIFFEVYDVYLFGKKNLSGEKYFIIWNYRLLVFPLDPFLFVLTTIILVSNLKPFSYEFSVLYSETSPGIGGICCLTWGRSTFYSVRRR